MTELVTLNKNCEICGRKNCANPGWPSWMAYVCMGIGLEREKARADAAATSCATTTALRIAELENENKELRSALCDARFTSPTR